MILKENPHNAVVRDLEDRLRQAHPRDEIFTDFEYGTPTKTVGQIDLYRISERGQWYFYEVKTGKKKIKKAQEQFDTFKQSFPEYPVKGVYVHPEYGVKRLK